jgi:uncharacterized protein (DUF1330 family)
MPGDEPRYVRLMALEVRDGESYARYRREMAPLLASCGGRFDHDFAVSEVLTSSAGERTNRVFAMSFPERAAAVRFFEDPAYLEIRARLFEPAVASVTQLAEFTASMG